MKQSRVDYTSAAEIESSRQRLAEQIEWLDRLPANISTILDIGCGPGFHSKYFQDRGMQPTALDTVAAAFQFHGRIPFLNCPFSELPPGRFDAIFASHLLEHSPNTMQTLLEWREKLVPGGYLIVIVPRYSPLVCSEHYVTGWNVGQLAAVLVAAGFDCRESTFAELGIHVCGYGRKADIPSAEMQLPATIPWLPAALARSIFSDGVHEFLGGDLEFATPDEIHQRIRQESCEVPRFLLEDGRDLRFGEEAWGGVDAFHGEPGQDLSDCAIHVAALVQGEACPLRLALGAGPANDVLANVSERWFRLTPGMNFLTLYPHHFKRLRGNLDLRTVRFVSIGGMCREAACRLWVYAADGRNLLSPDRSSRPCDCGRLP